MAAVLKESKQKEITTNFRFRDTSNVVIKKQLSEGMKEPKKPDPESVFGYGDSEQNGIAYNRPANEVRDSTRDEVSRQIEEHTKEKREYYPIVLPYAESGESLVGVPRIAIECDLNSDGNDPQCGRSKKIEAVQFQYRG